MISRWGCSCGCGLIGIGCKKIIRRTKYKLGIEIEKGLVSIEKCPNCGEVRICKWNTYSREFKWNNMVKKEFKIEEGKDAIKR